MKNIVDFQSVIVFFSNITPAGYHPAGYYEQILFAQMNASSLRKLVALLAMCTPLHSYGDLLKYRCEIPEGLEKKLVLVAKDGTKSEADAHQMYRHCHRKEWINAVRRHLAKGDAPLHLLFREDVQELGIHTTARRVGKLEAEVMINKASLIHQSERLDDLLRQLLSKELASEQPGTGQPATRPVVEPEGGDKPQPEAEGRSR